MEGVNKKFINVSMRNENENSKNNYINKIKLEEHLFQKCDELINCFLHSIFRANRKSLEKYGDTSMVQYDSFMYENFIENLSQVQYSLNDIEYLIKKGYVRRNRWKVKNKEEGKLFGLFISAAINNVIEEENEVHLDFRNFINPHFISKIGYGFRRGKMKIVGNIGSIGEYMRGGEIITIGNIQGPVGNTMYNGKITINGNVRGNVGRFMHGGLISVNGNVYGNVGDVMFSPTGLALRNNIQTESEGGKIFVFGNVYGNVGIGMMRGEIDIKGNVYGNVGSFMSGGNIIIDGNVEGIIGYMAQNGKIWISGSYREISNSCRADVNIESNFKSFIENLF